MARSIPESGHEEIARRLRQELEEVERLRSPVAALASTGGTGADRAGTGEEDLAARAQLNGQREAVQMASERLAQRARRVSRAIERLERGEWGVCELCGEPIAPRRLQALPDATTCVDCQSRLERALP